MATPTASPQVSSTVGLKNVVIAPLTKDTETEHTYGALQLMAGAIEASITPENADPDVQHADDVEFDVLYPDPELTFKTKMADVPLAGHSENGVWQPDRRQRRAGAHGLRPSALLRRGLQVGRHLPLRLAFQGQGQACHRKLRHQGRHERHPPDRRNRVDSHQAHPRQPLSGSGGRRPERLYRRKGRHLPDGSIRADVYRVGRVSKHTKLSTPLSAHPRQTVCFYMEVNPLSLEALSRNGHNLQLGEFECAGPYQIPVIQPVTVAEKLRWIPFNAARSDALRGAHGVHFFIDDYLFERCWNDPARYAKLLGEFWAVLSPDFSLFTDYPPAVQIYNHWRKHLLAAFWQQMGLTVIPSICWSDESSFEWCFDGEPICGTVAVSSVGTQKAPEARRLFLLGYSEMLIRLKPEKILFFGDVPEGCTGNIEKHTSFHAGLVHAREKR